MDSQHRCRLEKKSSDSNREAEVGNKLKRYWLKCIQISSVNPRSLKFYRSDVAIRKEKRRHLMSKSRYVIHPFSKFRAYYNIYLCFFYYTCLIVKALDFGYNKHEEPIFLGFGELNLAVDILCWVDIILNFMTGYTTTKRRVEMSFTKIARHYIFGPFFITDVLSSLPSHLPMYVIEESWIQQTIMGVLTLFGIFKIVRLITLVQIIRQVAEYFTIRSSAVLFTIHVIIVTTTVIHWMSACLYLIPRVTTQILFLRKNDNAGWIHVNNLDKQRVAVRYCWGFFRGSAHLLGIRLWFLFKLVLGEDLIASLVIYMIGRILMALTWVILATAIINSRNLDIKYYGMINELEEYMKYKQLPDTLIERILNFYKYKYSGKYLKEQLVTSLLSRTLRNEINTHLCKSLIEGVSIFAELTPSQLTEVINKLEEKIYLPQDIIYESGDTADCIFFVAFGTVAVYTHSGKEIGHLQDGAYFGEVPLVLKLRKRMTNVIAIETCQIYKLNKKDFERLFLNNRQVFRKMLIIAEKRNKITLSSENLYKQELMQESIRREKPKKTMQFLE